MKMRSVIACLVLALSPLAALADNVALLRGFMAETKSLQAEFTQTILSARSKAPQESRGSVAISRPGRFRWVVTAPFSQTLVGDGEKVWLYDPELQQVTVRRLGDALGGTPAALLAGEGGASAEASFAFRDGGAKDGLQWVEATPRDGESSFARVRFGFSGKALAKMELNDHFGQLTVIVFRNLRLNAPQPADQFRFTVPAGVDVIGE